MQTWMEWLVLVKNYCNYCNFFIVNYVSCWSFLKCDIWIYFLGLKYMESKIYINALHKYIFKNIHKNGQKIYWHKKKNLPIFFFAHFIVYFDIYLKIYFKIDIFFAAWKTTSVCLWSTVKKEKRSRSSLDVPQLSQKLLLITKSVKESRKTSKVTAELKLVATGPERTRVWLR